LKDTGKAATTHGQVMIGIALVADLVVICMTVILPILGGSSTGRLKAAAWILGKAIDVIKQSSPGGEGSGAYRPIRLPLRYDPIERARR